MDPDGDSQCGPDGEILLRPRHPGVLSGHLEGEAGANREVIDDRRKYYLRQKGLSHDCSKEAIGLGNMLKDFIMLATTSPGSRERLGNDMLYGRCVIPIPPLTMVSFGPSWAMASTFALSLCRSLKN